MRKTLLLIAISSLSATAMAQQGSNPNPFNNEPIRNERPAQPQNSNTADRTFERELQRQERVPRSGTDVLRQAGENLIDNADIPRPIEGMPRLPEIPLPTTVEDIYREASDFRVRGTINNASIEYSNSQNIYRISGGSTITDLPKPPQELPELVVKKDGESLTLSGGKEPNRQ